jgi:nucleoside 2-deoxyribosyltransferase
VGEAKITSDSTDFVRRVAQILEQNHIPFREGTIVGGVQTDSLIETPGGRSIVVEAKNWSATKANLERAVRQIQFFQQVLLVDRALFVLRNLDFARPAEGLLTEKDLMDVVIEESRCNSLPFSVVGVLKPPFRQATAVEKTIFAAMPFSPEYDDVYFVAMAHAADCIGGVCQRVDREEFQGDVVEEIKRLIRGSVAVIADLSESRPNVLYEVGFAHALGRPTIHIASTPLDQLPFDVRNWNTLQYSRGQTFTLRDGLAKRLVVLLTHGSQKIKENKREAENH